jgi:hypothetical protein
VRVHLSVRKTKYANINKSTESYSEGCGTPSKFYGDVYNLTSKKASGKTDSFTSSLKANKVHFDGGIYKATLNLHVSVSISP